MHWRQLRATTRTGIALTALLGAIYICSTIAWARWELGPPYIYFGLGSGALAFEWSPAPASGHHWYRLDTGFFEKSRISLGCDVSIRSLQLPLWIPFLLLAIPSYILERRDRLRIHRIEHSLCPHCGYSLAGLATSPRNDLTCPECGRFYS